MVTDLGERWYSSRGQVSTEPNTPAESRNGPKRLTPRCQRMVGELCCRRGDVYLAVNDLLVSTGKLTSKDRKSTRLNSSHTEIYTLSLHDALPIFDPSLPKNGW